MSYWLRSLRAAIGYGRAGGAGARGARSTGAQIDPAFFARQLERRLVARHARLADALDGDAGRVRQALALASPIPACR